MKRSVSPCRPATTGRSLRSSTMRLLRCVLVAAVLFPIATACTAGDADEGRKIVELLGLEPGSVVADVGAGDGDWIHHLLEAVIPGGRVWATEVKPDLLEDLRERHGEDPVEVVAGDQDSTGLPEDCCDAILLRLVYHHFRDPGVMMDDLAAALRENGRLLLVETDTREDWRELDGVPEREGHGISPDRLASELEGHGWAILSRHDAWDGDPERYAVVLAPHAAR